MNWAGGAGRQDGVHMVHTFEEMRTRTPADPNEAALEATMQQAAWEALLRDAVQGLRPPYTTQEPGMGRSGDQGAEEKGTTANATTHTKEGHTTTGGPAPPQPHRTPHDSRGRTPQHAPPKQASDAIQMTPAHTYHPPETGRGMEGTPTRGEQATPTEEAAGNSAAWRTTTPSPPGNDPGRHKGHLTGTGRGRRHGHSDQG